MKLHPGEFIVSFEIDKKFLTAPFYHVKKTKNEEIDYPLLTLCTIKDGQKIKSALSGLTHYPFMSDEMDEILNDTGCDREVRAKKAIATLSPIARSDLSGSVEYKLFVLEYTLLKMLEDLQA